MSTLQDIYAFWNLQSSNIHGEEFTGYEPVMKKLDSYTTADFKADPDKVVNEIFDIYRSINLVPIIYYTEKGLLRAIRDFQNISYLPVRDNKIGLGNNKGQPISRFLFPNMMTAEPKGRGTNSLKDRFYNDRKLKRAIRLCFEAREGIHLARPTALRRALELVTGENIQNFKPQNARSIVEHLCPVLWGRVYDYSMGYGGRLLGVSSSNMKYNYVGVDPNTETIKYLTYLNELLEESLGVKGDINCSTSEDFKPQDIDCAFSSPPYFNLEKYSDEDTQCMVRYQTLEDWYDGYAIPTMENIYNGLNSDGIFATNIADYKSYGNKTYEVVDKWIESAERVGFKQAGIIKMTLNTRPGVGNDKKSGREKWEGVYVFKK
jgi:hypothetical protein